MNIDYYQELQITRDATLEQIQNAFKRLSVKHDPMKNPSNQQCNQQKFGQICEAYDVLSHPERRGIYDKYGSYGLKNGVTNELGQKIDGYTFLGNSDQIFKDFFGSTQPFLESYEMDGTDVYGSLLGDAFGAKNMAKAPKAKDITVTLKCTLAEFYNGSAKCVKYSRERVQPDGRTKFTVAQEQLVEVKPGYSEKTVLTYAKKGHEQFGQEPSNLVVKLALDDDGSAKFLRRGDNLIYTHSLTLKEALTSAPISIRTLDDRVINVNLDQVITPQTVHKIPGEGMPQKPDDIVSMEDPEALEAYLKEFEKLPRGDLYVRFDIVFPDLNTADKSAIIELLRKNKAETNS